jgi:hypothetical protein
MKADEHLLFMFANSSTGATIHDDVNIVQVYKGFITVGEFEKAMEKETQMRSMLATRRLANL